jgi:hypothetical protein
MGCGQTGFAKVIALDRSGWLGPIVRADHCPPGKSVTCSIVDLSSPITKNILLRGWVETAIHQANPVPIRGAFRDRHGRWVRDAMDVMAPLTNGAKADGEVVWS